MSQVVVPVPVAPFLNAQQIAVTTTAAAFATQRLQNGARVKNMAASTSPIYVGAAGVTATTGYEVAVGAESPLIPVKDAAQIFVITSTGTARACLIGN
jgi:hypothetical protein